MALIIKTIAEAVSEAVKELEEKDSIREELIKGTRDADRLIRRSISLIHLGKYKEAKESLDKAHDILKTLRNKASRFPDLVYGGLLSMSFQEYVEALSLLTILREGRVPSYKEVDVPPAPYLSGLADVIGELRRRIIDLIREERLEEADRLFEIMEGLYLVLREISYPEALVPGLRRKCDTARHLVEATRAGLVEAQLKLRLLKELRKASGERQRRG